MQNKCHAAEVAGFLRNAFIPARVEKKAFWNRTGSILEIEAVFTPSQPNTGQYRFRSAILTICSCLKLTPIDVPVNPGRSPSPSVFQTQVREGNKKRAA